MANREDMINIYYRDGTKTSKHRHNNIFIYSADNMDNDDIISHVDANPTCRRTKEDLNRLKNEQAG
jgi:hypothetical protein